MNIQPKTATTFGELSLGDRFYFVSDSTKVVLQITRLSETGTGRSFYNRMDYKREPFWQFDKQAARERPVIFLRHADQL